MWSGVVPQQPPTMFTQPRSANSPTMRAMSAGPRSNWPISFGKPALGWQLIQRGETSCKASMCGRIGCGPSAQFMPTESIGKCAIAFQNASTSWPDTNVRPPSPNVPEIITGTRTLCSSKYRLIANRQALRLSVSMTVSGRRISTPASTSVATCAIVRIGHFVERGSAIAGVVDLGRDRHLLGGRANRTGDEARLVRRALAKLVARSAGTGDGGELISRIDIVGQVELDGPDGAGAKRVRFDDVGAGGQVAAVDIGDFGRMRQAEDVGEVLEVFVVVGEALAAHGPLIEAEGLNLRAHRAIQQQDAFGEQ